MAINVIAGLAFVNEVFDAVLGSTTEFGPFEGASSQIDGLRGIEMGPPLVMELLDDLGCFSTMTTIGMMRHNIPIKTTAAIIHLRSITGLQSVR